MGFLFSKIFRSLIGSKEVRILILGIDNAGKTTILYKLSSNEVIQSVPTIGFNLETFAYKNIKFQMWDLGGQTGIRPYWRSYYPNTNGIVYVIDSTDKDRLEVTKQELMMLIEEEDLRSIPLMVFANKQDVSGALTEMEIANYLQLHQIKNRPWAIFKCSALTGYGLSEGMEWISAALQK